MNLKRVITAGVAVMVISMSAICRTDTSTKVFTPDIRSLQVKAGNSDDYLAPIITLDSPERLTISFDELGDERSYLRYSLVHCDRFWRPDGMPEQMFIDGFNEAEVEDYALSQATVVHYVHYSITLPNKDMRIKASGNYLLRVYEESDPDRVLFQARFSVSESAATVSGSVSPVTDIDYKAAHQQLELCVDTRKTSVNNPAGELTVKVMQNGDVSGEVTLGRPLRMEGNKLFFEHDPKLIFPAGNEFHRFETVSLRYPGMNVCANEFIHPTYHVELCPDSPRAGQPYVYDRTQHGAFKVRNADAEGTEWPDTGADYALTHFSLQMPPLHDSQVYIDGDLTLGAEPEPMIYSPERGAYEQSLFLKQGSYNYRYVTRKVGKHDAPANGSLIDGNHYQTSNRYTVTVYYRPPGDFYDRLIGSAVLDSQRQ